MNNTLPDLDQTRGRRRSGFVALANGLRHGLQWRLLLAWVALMLLPALLIALPVTGWLHAQFGHSLHAGAIAAGANLPLFAEALSAIGDHGPWLKGSAFGATLVALLLSPWLTGMVVASIRAGHTLRLGVLLRAGLGEYLRMLRMLLWSLLPLGAALAAGIGAMNLAGKQTEQAILASEAENAARLAMILLAVLLVLAHASVEAGRGWLGADLGLRSVIRAWWRGCKLLLRRPLATLVVYLGTSVVGYGLALLFGVVRVQVDGSSVGGWLAAFALTQLVVVMLAWGRIARLYGLAELATGAKVVPSAQTVAVAAPSHAAPALA